MGQQTKGARSGLSSRERDELGTAAGTRGESTSEARERRRRARERDEPFERAYHAGRRGDDPAEFQTDDRLFDVYQQGAQDAKGERRQGRRDARIGALKGQASGAGQTAAGWADDGAGFLLGLFVYALVVNFLRNGPAGARGWLAAKFLNRPMSSAARPAAPTKPTGPSKPLVFR